MAKRTGRCVNFGECNVADSKKAIEILETQDFACPECKSTLAASNSSDGLQGQRSKKKLLIIVSICLCLLVLSFASYLYSKRGLKTVPPPKPEHSSIDHRKAEEIMGEAKIAYDQKKYVLCIEKTKEALTIIPSYEAAKERLAICYYDSKTTFDDAISVSKQILEDNPRNITAKKILMASYFYKKDVNEAKKWLTEVKRQKPDDEDLKKFEQLIQNSSNQ